MQEHIASLSPVTVVTRTTIARSRVLAGTVALFAVTMFTGASLLFLVQPMFAKLALPRLGGSPSVWNTCVLFFQATLLLGYLYAHFSTRWLGVRRQVYFHLLLLIVPFVALPLTMGAGQPSSASPIWWLLSTMTLSVGLPFFVVSTTAPLLQRWFATLPVPSARDPYFLYAASNLGSMLALLAYPFLLEPAIGTRQQTWLWTIGYIVFVALTAACAMAVRACANEEPGDSPAAPVVRYQPLSAGKRGRWVILSFIPSSLMLGVTTHISTDVAAVPLLWVLPLAMYLGTFVLAFSPREVLPDRWLIRVLPVLIAGCLATVILNTGSSWSIPLHLAMFSVCAMVCHRELATHRPDARHLTEFYIWMSFGGMLGGVFNGLVAPQIFSRILEYPLVLALAILATPSAFRRSRPGAIVPILGVSAFVVLLILGLWATGLMAASGGIRELLPTCGIVFMAVSLFLYQPRAFGTMSLVFTGVIAVGVPIRGGTVLLAARSFFGVYQVIDAPNHGHHRLQHGSTLHGRQEMPADASCEPTAYYHRSNPIGQLFGSSGGRFGNVAVVGLGSGALACYAASGDQWTFYEIDPLMERIARDPRYFTHLQNSRGNLNVVLGDGRLTLQRATPGSYDLIVLDAFSSDAIPVHLLTREAVQLYLSRLRTNGVVAVHISNNYLNLEPILGALARREGLFALANFDRRIPEADANKGRMASHWVLLARSREPLAHLSGQPGWYSPKTNERIKPWTDDYSNILQALLLPTGS